MKELGVTHKRLIWLGRTRWACSFNLGSRGQRKHVRRVIRCVTKTGAQDGAECAVKHYERLLASPPPPPRTNLPTN
jgi:hypothetical protein